MSFLFHFFATKFPLFLPPPPPPPLITLGNFLSLNRFLQKKVVILFAKRMLSYYRLQTLATSETRAGVKETATYQNFLKYLSVCLHACEQVIFDVSLGVRAIQTQVVRCTRLSITFMANGKCQPAICPLPF